MLRAGQLTVREVADFAADAGKENYIEAEPEVNDLLDHKDPIVRYNAMGTLAYEWGRSHRTDRILEILSVDPDDDCRRQAAVALGSLFRGRRERHVLDVLVGIAKNSNEPMDLRASSYVSGLSMIGVSRDFQPSPVGMEIGPNELLALDEYLKSV